MQPLAAPLLAHSHIRSRAARPLGECTPRPCRFCGRRTRSVGAICGSCRQTHSWGRCCVCGLPTPGPRYCPAHVRPEHFCPHCGGLMRKKAHMCYMCAARRGLVLRHDRHEAYRRLRAPVQRLPAGTRCRLCGGVATEQHHPDPLASRTIGVCHSCHMKITPRGPRAGWAAGTVHDHYRILPAGHGMRFSLRYRRDKSAGYTNPQEAG